MPQPNQYKRLRVLLADDQDSIRALMKMVLKELGLVQVDEAKDGLEALQRLSTQAYDLILCDWNMPKLSGIEVLRNVRDCEETSTLPFLMVTSTSDLKNVKEAMAVGVTDYLVKPFQPQKMMDKVSKVLSESDHHAQVMMVDRLG
jgi:two-component system chemotaxis response regulator CheY